MKTIFDSNKNKLTKYLFFTGKGRVGKTTIAAAIALGLSEKGISYERKGCYNGMVK